MMTYDYIYSWALLTIAPLLIGLPLLVLVGVDVNTATHSCVVYIVFRIGWLVGRARRAEEKAARAREANRGPDGVT